MILSRIRRLCAIIGAITMTMTSTLLGDDKPADKTRSKAELEFVAVRDAYVAKFRPLFIKSSQAWWVAQTTGSDKAFADKKAAENELVELHSDKATFAKLKAMRDKGEVHDPILHRELDTMYRTFLPGQGDKELQKRIVEIQNDVEQIFNTHRGKVGDKEMTENDIRKVLSESKNSSEVEKAWKAYMDVGGKVESKLKEVAKLRNDLAHSLNYPNFFVMQLAVQEIDDKELLKLFDELDQLTSGPFKTLKQEIDRKRAERFDVKEDKLRPWHFGDLFFQEAPEMEAVNLDSIYEKQDLLALTQDYYKSLDMPVEAILSRSDMYEKKGKSSHAFCTNIDRDQDVRVLANIKPNVYWADTVLHEVGHAVYEQYIRNDVPFLLHEPSHSLTTEGMAMMFGAMVKNEDFLTRVVKVPQKDAAPIVAAAGRSSVAERLIFSRWAQVVVRFEKAMYENPDQDLGKLWWDLKKRYQMLDAPEGPSRPDYAAKVHIVANPVYYHSYLMGDLFACQVQEYIANKILKIDDPNRSCFYDHKEVGTYLKDQVFGPGDLYSWNELTKRATGEPLSAKAFAHRCGMK